MGLDDREDRLHGMALPHHGADVTGDVAKHRGFRRMGLLRDALERSAILDRLRSA